LRRARQEAAAPEHDHDDHEGHDHDHDDHEGTTTTCPRGGHPRGDELEAEQLEGTVMTPTTWSRRVGGVELPDSVTSRTNCPAARTKSPTTSRARRSRWGQKVNPYGSALGVTTTGSRAGSPRKEYTSTLIEDWKIRDY